MKKLHLFFTGLLVCGALFMSSCDRSDNPVVKPSNPTGIPDDADAKPNPILDPSTLNTTIPNFNWNYGYENGELVIRLDLTGVKDPYTNDWVELYGMNSDKTQNIWVSVDGIPKGFTIEKVDNQDKGIVDLVFLVDNSGSMDEEADAIAKNIIDWANNTLSKTLDVNFGCVGYDGEITGAINLTTAEKLSEFLNYSTGTRRTLHFGGPDASDLKSKVGPYKTSSSVEECGVAALRFADENFNFRPGANRVYVNFTDEPNQPRGKSDFSTEWVKNNWPTVKGTIYTVYSDDAVYLKYKNGKRGDELFTHVINQNEHPWKLSEYTRGDSRFYPSSFAGVTLNDLHVTGAMLNAYIIRFKNVLLDGQVHDVWLTVESTSKNGDILADEHYDVLFQ